ncbi:hypothetical protein LJR090_002571 [Bosea sp. LjRoot90]|uniref:hypothetical protein n=1 Tax=Bosea sp. LjRoot90 TaxID=3342342 RepID=UPI003ECDA39C
MFRKKTLFILGAGASCELKLPSGEQLIPLITNFLQLSRNSFDLEGNKELIGYISDMHNNNYAGLSIDPATKAVYSPNQLIETVQFLRRALPQAISIDNFLDAHKSDKCLIFLGKLAIAFCILSAERQSALFKKETEQLTIKAETIKDTWYDKFFKMLNESVSTDNVDDIFSNISIISFNYDRCIEHFLYLSIMNYYKLEPEAAKIILSKLQLYHPYGQVGMMPWHKSGFAARFGGSDHIRAEQLLNHAAQIKTFTEREHDPAFVEQMQRAVMHAQTIVFLGFGFHPLNMELIRPKNSVVNNIFATGYRVSSANRIMLQQETRDWLSRDDRLPVHIYDLSCADFLRDFERPIRFG